MSDTLTISPLAKQTCDKIRHESKDAACVCETIQRALDAATLQAFDIAGQGGDEDDCIGKQECEEP